MSTFRNPAIERAFETLRTELAAASLEIAVARDGLLTRDELVAKLDAEPDPEEKTDA